MNSYEKENLIKYDTVKFRTKIDYFKNRIIKFNQNYNKKGDLTGIYYNSKNDNSIPFDLYVALSYTKQSMTIEFSSKILKDDYYKLISEHTFKKCLENLNQLGICEIDVEAICLDCTFCKLHITKDIKLQLTDNILDTLNLHVNNYRRYNWKHYEKSGITFSKDVISRDCKETISIYNKEKELASSKNNKFINQLKFPNILHQHFKGVTRIEAIFDTPEKIRTCLNIQNTSIVEVFSSTENPILNQFNKVFGNDEAIMPCVITTPEEYDIKNTILFYNHDLKMIRQYYKPAYKSRSGLDNKMDKVENLNLRLLNTTPTNSTILTEIRTKLAS